MAEHSPAASHADSARPGGAALSPERSQRCDDSPSAESARRKGADARKGGRMGMRKHDPDGWERIAPVVPISICIERADFFFLIIAHTGIFLDYFLLPSSTKEWCSQVSCSH